MATSESGKKLIAVTRIIPNAGMDLLRSAADIEMRLWERESPPAPDELADLIHGCDGVLTLLTEAMTPEVLAREPQLKVISNLAVGFDNVDVEAATARGVMVCNTPGVLTETTADFTWTLLMAAARRVVEGADYVRAGKWVTWGPMLLLGQDVHHATIGIVGFGRIGKEVAKRARGFDMRILAYDTNRDEEAAEVLGVEFMELDELLQESDFVTLHVALTDETRNLIAARELQRMKSTAILINAARGPVVDTDALVDALKGGTIAGAALDVTEPEPLPGDHPLSSLPNAIVVPHIASATVATRNEMARMAAENLLAGIRGNRPPNLVNPEVVE